MKKLTFFLFFICIFLLTSCEKYDNKLKSGVYIMGDVEKGPAIFLDLEDGKWEFFAEKGGNAVSGGVLTYNGESAKGQNSDDTVSFEMSYVAGNWIKAVSAASPDGVPFINEGDLLIFCEDKNGVPSDDPFLYFGDAESALQKALSYEAEVTKDGQTANGAKYFFGFISDSEKGRSSAVLTAEYLSNASKVKIIFSEKRISEDEAVVLDPQIFLTREHLSNSVFLPGDRTEQTGPETEEKKTGEVLRFSYYLFDGSDYTIIQRFSNEGTTTRQIKCKLNVSRITVASNEDDLNTRYIKFDPVYPYTGMDFALFIEESGVYSPASPPHLKSVGTWVMTSDDYYSLERFLSKSKILQTSGPRTRKLSEVIIYFNHPHYRQEISKRIQKTTYYTIREEQ